MVCFDATWGVVQSALVPNMASFSQNEKGAVTSYHDVHGPCVSIQVYVDATYIFTEVANPLWR